MMRSRHPAGSGRRGSDDVILILLGPPGAGKGTQAKLLAVEYRISHVSTGDMFREHKARGTEIGKKVQAIIDAGGLVTDDITNAMVKERLAAPDVVGGLILDGYPRTTAQADFLAGALQGMGRAVDRVVSYEVPEELVVERISGRRSCPKCGTVYHVSQSPPKRDGFCDKDGTGLVLRKDDEPENVKNRLREYAAKTAPLKKYYQDRKLLSEVEGVGSPEGILAATKKAFASQG
jgi:adenylate kinase